MCIRDSSKLDHFNSFLKKHNLNKSDVLFMGDDIPDFEVMKEAGIPVCPSDADSEIKQVSSYVSDKKGGEGCVRDVIEQVLRSVSYTHLRAHETVLDLVC